MFKIIIFLFLNENDVEDELFTYCLEILRKQCGELVYIYCFCKDICIFPDGVGDLFTGNCCLLTYDNLIHPFEIIKKFDIVCDYLLFANMSTYICVDLFLENLISGYHGFDGPLIIAGSFDTMSFPINIQYPKADHPFIINRKTIGRLHELDKDFYDNWDKSFDTDGLKHINPHTYALIGYFAHKYGIKMILDNQISMINWYKSPYKYYWNPGHFRTLLPLEHYQNNNIAIYSNMTSRDTILCDHFIKLDVEVLRLLNYSGCDLLVNQLDSLEYLKNVAKDYTKILLLCEGFNGIFSSILYYIIIDNMYNNIVYNKKLAKITITNRKKIDKGTIDIINRLVKIYPNMEYINITELYDIDMDYEHAYIENINVRKLFNLSQYINFSKVETLTCVNDKHIDYFNLTDYNHIYGKSYVKYKTIYRGMITGWKTIET